MKRFIIKSLMGMALVAGSSSQAAITYVDASAANVTLANGSALTPSTTSNAYTDSNWSLRTSSGLASGGTVYETGASANTSASIVGEDVPTIKQTVTGLTVGTYEVYAYFWVAYNVRWGISAGTTETSLTSAYGTGTSTTDFVYSASGVTSVSVANLTDGTFAVAPTQAVGGTDRVLAQFFLGTVTVDSSGTLSAFIDNQVAVNSGNSPSVTNSRGWFDGIGYQVVPEPSAALLGLLGLLPLVRRRR